MASGGLKANKARYTFAWAIASFLEFKEAEELAAHADYPRGGFGELLHDLTFLFWLEWGCLKCNERVSYL